MVLGAAGGALAAAASGVSAVWGYNRDNYMYDREMRQKNEFKVAMFRSRQASLWREDVRDLIGLTERKMDSYLIVNTLQLGMCVGLFTEGRLEPGTPQWLLRFYMCSLGAAFMYLLMSVWLSMHASVVAQTSGARLLTQLVRLPIPTWRQLEAMRSYGASFEKLGRNMLRIPFISGAPTPMTSTAARSSGTLISPQCSASPVPRDNDGHHKHGLSSTDTQIGCPVTTGPPDEGGSVATCDSTAEAPGLAAVSGGPSYDLSSSSMPASTEATNLAPDPWDLELDGHGIYELQNRPNSTRPHIGKVRHEARHWTSYDAFARVSMSFGTNQLLYAITYYCMGYVSIEDGAPWPALCIAAVMLAIAVTLVHLDMALTHRKLQTAACLLCAGPACASITLMAMFYRYSNAEFVARLFLSVAYVSHGLWLWWSLKALTIERHLGGAWLPMNFRTVLYLDVFGWFHHHHPERDHSACKNSDEKLVTNNAGCHRGASEMDTCDLVDQLSQTVSPICSEPVSPATLMRHKDRLTRDLEMWQSDNVQTMMEPQDKERVSKLSEQFHSAVDQDPAAAGIEHVPAEIELPNRACLAQGTSSSSTSSTLPRKQKETWIRLTGQTDFGTVVPYLYNPQTGDIRTMEHGEVRPRCASDISLSTERTTLSITQTEEHIEHFVRKAEKLKTLQASQEAQLQSDCHGQPVVDSVEETSGVVTTASSWVCSAVNADCDSHEYIVVTSPRRGQQRTLQREVSALRSECFGPTLPREVSSGTSSSTSSVLPHDTHQIHQEEDHSDGPATDFGDIDPGKLPWLVFRFATLLLAVLWFTGPLLTFGLIGGMAEFGTAPLLEIGFRANVNQVDVRGDVPVDKLLSAAVAFETSGGLPAFAEGEEIKVNWPRSAAFSPRSLSCDPSGKQLVVSDDFGVYSGQLWEAPRQNVNLLTEHQGRRLRGLESMEQILADFTRAEPCTALEGQAVKDIGVVCSEQHPSECRVLVLHSRGHRLAECPLEAPGPVPVPGALPLVRGMSEAKNDTTRSTHRKGVKPVREWTIPGSWLNLKGRGKKEHVESIAVNNECLSRARMLHANEKDMSGCVAVGTTSGRVVQMRRHITEAHQLVPEWNMVQLPHSVGQGSLHVVPGEFVLALHPQEALVRAFDAVKGDVLGTWRLPEAIHWITLCGGGGNIYMLGIRKRAKKKNVNGQRVMLWRFPAPSELKSRTMLDYSKAIGSGQEI